MNADVTYHRLPRVAAAVARPGASAASTRSGTSTARTATAEGADHDGKHAADGAGPEQPGIRPGDEQAGRRRPPRVVEAEPRRQQVGDGGAGAEQEAVAHHRPPGGRSDDARPASLRGRARGATPARRMPRPR